MRRVSDVSNTCVGGDFDGCEGGIRPFLDETLDGVSESIKVQKLCSAHVGGKPNKEKFSAVTTHTLVMDPCGNRPRKCSLSGGETA